MVDTSRARGGNAQETHVRNEPAGRFAQVPETLIEDPNVSHLALRVWAVLRRHGDSPENCYPSHARIAEKCGVSHRSIAKPMRDLEAAGWIERVARFDVNGSRVADGYFVRFHPLPPAHPDVDPAQMCATTTQESVDPPRSTTGTPHAEVRGLIEEEREPYNESHSTTRNNAPSRTLARVDVPSTPKPKGRKYPQDFETFWHQYPRKVSKPAALKAWKAAKKRADVETITAGLHRHLGPWTTFEESVIPHAATWLNQDRWCDPPPKPRNGTPNKTVDNRQRIAGSLARIAGNQ